MLKASAETIAKVTGGAIVLGDADLVAVGLAVDSRVVSPGVAFVALSGERVDGHAFAVDAAERGARVLVVGRDVSPQLVAAGVRAGDVAVVVVADTVEALQQVAAWHRRRLTATVVGITGSTGKTTTKDFMTSVLATSMRVTATVGNRNNEIGLPLTILSAGDDTDVLVVEMGMRGLGQIAQLAHIAHPDFGLVTNVGTSHIELLGTQEAVASAKGELVRAIGPDGAVFLNGDDAYSEVLAVDAAAPVTTYGLCEQCDVRAHDITLDGLSRAAFNLVTEQGETGVVLPVPGRHNVYNALAAAAVALRLGVPVADVSQGLASARLTQMRMESFHTAAGILVLNDAYNANPSSMRAGLDTLASISVPGRRIAVLGDMAELGSLSELAHFELGETAARLKVDVLVTVGERAQRIADGAVAEGMATSNVRPCATVDEAVEVLDDLLETGDGVLVKASRVMGLERVVEGIVTPRAR